MVEILEHNEIARDDGSNSIQQKIKLKWLEGDWKDKEIIFDGTEFDILSAPNYDVGDKVMVNYSSTPEGVDNFILSALPVVALFIGWPFFLLW